MKLSGREMLEATKERLLKLREELTYFRMEVVLRAPLPEELEELRGFVKEKAT